MLWLLGVHPAALAAEGTLVAGMGLKAGGATAAGRCAGGRQAAGNQKRNAESLAGSIGPADPASVSPALALPHLIQMTKSKVLFSRKQRSPRLWGCRAPAG